jgi:hypothetical protein
MMVRILRAAATVAVTSAALVGVAAFSAQAAETLLHRQCLLVENPAGTFSGTCVEIYTDNGATTVAGRLVVCSVSGTTTNLTCASVGSTIIREVALAKTGFEDGTGPTITFGTRDVFIIGVCPTPPGICAGGFTVEVPTVSVDPSNIGDVYVNGTRVLDL